VSPRAALQLSIIRRHLFVVSISTVLVGALLGYSAWRSLQPREEVQLNCVVGPPQSSGALTGDGITFRPSTRLESGFAISYTEPFAVGSTWKLAWDSPQPGLRAVFLYDATTQLIDTRPHIANVTGSVAIWWNDIVTASNGDTIADAPWATTFERTRPGKYCLTILETSQPGPTGPSRSRKSADERPATIP